jgi:hypothetical protein
VELFEGQALDGSLIAEVRNQPEYGQYTPVNPVTTLIAKRLQSKPAISYQQSVKDVTRFLGIPAAYGVGINLTPKQFSGALFAQASANSGGTTKLFSELLVELDAGKNHYYRQNLLQDAELNIAGFVAKGIANGILGKAGGEAFSSILGAIGIGESGDAAATAAAQAAKLAEISAAISALSDKLDTVEATLQSAIDFSTYSVVLVQNVKPLVDINTWIDSELRVLALDPGNVTRRDMLNAYILKNLVQGGMEKWHSSIYGLTRDISLIQLWSKNVQQLSPES